jgi:hypothetical protein
MRQFCRKSSDSASSCRLPEIQSRVKAGVYQKDVAGRRTARNVAEQPAKPTRELARRAAAGVVVVVSPYQIPYHHFLSPCAPVAQVDRAAVS